MTKRLLMVLLLSLPALALPPSRVVKKLYDTHLTTHGSRETVQRVPQCLTPGFLGIVERALRRQPPGPWVDVDLFTNNQMGFGFYEMGAEEIHGKDAIVNISLWIGRVDPNNRFNKKLLSQQKARIYLTDVGDGDGFQIRDIEFLPTRSNPKSFWIRAWLVPIADGRR